MLTSEAGSASCSQEGNDPERMLLGRPGVPAAPTQQERTVGLRSEIGARLLLMTGLASLFALAWHHFSTIPMLVLGQPSSTGQLQRDREAPFFRELAARSGLPLSIDYVTADAYGLKDDHQLKAMRDGRIDLVSLRFMQNIENEPGLAGFDLPGMVSDFSQARRVVDAYGPSVDRYLQTSYGGKLLGVWSFGPQVMFCRDGLAGLNDLKGRKVRVANPLLAKVIGAVGAVPVILPFNDTREALSLGVVDCAITSAASGDFAGWDELSSHYYPLVFQFGFNGYVISRAKWQQLSTQQQTQLQQSFSRYSGSLWSYSQAQQQLAEACMTGAAACPQSRSNRLTRVAVHNRDRQLLQQLSRRIAVPEWLSLCERSHPGCSRDWRTRLAPVSRLADPIRLP